MDDSTFRCYRFSKADPPELQVGLFAATVGRAPDVIVVNPHDRDVVAEAIGQLVETLPHGGPLRGELWLS